MNGNTSIFFSRHLNALMRDDQPKSDAEKVKKKNCLQGSKPYNYMTYPWKKRAAAHQAVLLYGNCSIAIRHLGALSRGRLPNGDLP